MNYQITSYANQTNDTLYMAHIESGTPVDQLNWIAIESGQPPYDLGANAIGLDDGVGQVWAVSQNENYDILDYVMLHLNSDRIPDQVVTRSALKPDHSVYIEKRDVLTETSGTLTFENGNESDQNKFGGIVIIGVLDGDK